jgi:GT2 family glycosyltransferase
VVATTLPLVSFKALSECLDDAGPFAIRAVDAEQRLPYVQLQASRRGEPYHRLLALARRDGCPLGWVSIPVAADGTASLASVHALAERTPVPRSSLQRREGAQDDEPAAADGALLSVVVCTCAQVESVICCVDAILAGGHRSLEVIVVENRPRGSKVSDALSERFAGDPRIRCVEEALPGLGRARNAGLREARGALVAFTDDDVTVDASWIPALRRAFAANPEASCVAGLIAPLELETPEQVSLERFANYGKGFVSRVYSIRDPPPDQPLFPYTAGHFVSGANIAFRAAELRRLGGFDPALGTGTPSRGSEDLDVCIRALHTGAQLVYEPRALVWHRHPDTEAGLRRRAFDYGVALGSLVGKHLLMESDRWDIFSRIPGGVRYLLDPGSRKNASRGPGFPARLVWLERLGLLCGPFAYLRSRFGVMR